MLKISDFAEIAQISTSALRYYDEAGIFKPLHVDRVTGYRYYAVEQLVQLNRILALKDLGLDLTQIVRLLEEDLSSEAFAGMLRLRQAQLQQNIQVAQEQLARIEARIRYSVQEGSGTPPEVVLKPIKSTTVASSRTGVVGFMPNLEYAHHFMAMLQHQRIKPNGYTHYIYNKSASDLADYDVEIAVPVDFHSAERLRDKPAPEVAIRQLPEVPKMATAVHHGSPYAIVEAYQALGSWIQNQGYTITGPCRKVCLQWEGSLTDYLTEIQFPVEMSSTN